MVEQGQARSTISRLVSLIADPGVVSLIPASPHTFLEIDLGKFLRSSLANSIKNECCQLQAKVSALSTG